MPLLPQGRGRSPRRDPSRPPTRRRPPHTSRPLSVTVRPGVTKERPVTRGRRREPGPHSGRLTVLPMVDCVPGSGRRAREWDTGRLEVRSPNGAPPAGRAAAWPPYVSADFTHLGARPPPGSTGREPNRRHHLEPADHPPRQVTSVTSSGKEWESSRAIAAGGAPWVDSGGTIGPRPRPQTSSVYWLMTANMATAKGCWLPPWISSGRSAGPTRSRRANPSASAVRVPTSSGMV